MSVMNKNIKTVHIMYKGIFDPQELYLVIIDWMKSKQCEVIERKTKHKVKTFGEEIEIDVESWRDVNSYVRYWFRAFIKVEDANDVEVIKDGIKKKLKKCRAMIIISSDMELDYTDRFENSKFQLGLRNFLFGKVLKQNINAFWVDQLEYKTQELADVVKEYLNMETKGSAWADMW